MGKVEAVGSTIWRFVAGFLLLGIVSSLVSWVVYFVAFIFHGDDFFWVREVASALIGGAVGTFCGVWVLENWLKRFPGRTIAWVYIVMWGLAALMLLVRFLLVATGHGGGVTMKDVTTKLEIHQMIDAVAFCVVLWDKLIKPRENFMAKTSPHLLA